MNQKNHELGTIEASEKLIYDLYIELRRKVNEWATVTHQTAQARMGYVGQHLVSVVTGYSGGRSGARGADLVLPNAKYAEIKTCYRVDQLGKCNNCHARVASIEVICPECGSKDILRKDDSKWLIGIRNDEEFANILEPKYYYLVLFEFTNLESPDVIQASIWRVESTVPGFSYCMVDYYKNIRANSTSKAPFNLWPYQLKFDIMRPYLIYRSHITKDDKIHTMLFPGQNEAQLHPLKPLVGYSRSTNLTKERVIKFAEYVQYCDINKSHRKRAILEGIQQHLDRRKLSPQIVTDYLAKALYLSKIEKYLSALPSPLGEKVLV